MFPRTHKGEKSYRLKKRRLEIQIILSVIENQLKKYSSSFNHQLNILEFGCGNGFQIPYLQKLGVVTATDIFIPNNLNRMNQADFVECDISNSPFLDDQFDLIFSNHVIEHITTNVWLLLSIPAQYLQKMRAVVQQLNYSAKNDHSSVQKKIEGYDFPNSGNSSLFSILFDKIKPHGHGSIRNFWKCYKAFRKNSWYNLFNRHGFKVVTTQPLLLYAPSEWPIIPIMSVRGMAKICSSLLFLIEQR